MVKDVSGQILRDSVEVRRCAECFEEARDKMVKDVSGQILRDSLEVRRVQSTLSRF